MRYRSGGLIFGGAYTWRGLFSEFYGIYKRSHFKVHGNAIGRIGRTKKDGTENHPPYIESSFFPQCSNLNIVES